MLCNTCSISDSFTVLEVYFDVMVLVKDVKEKDNTLASEYDCYNRYYSIHVRTISRQLQAYFEGFVPYLCTLSDYSFYFLLSSY